MYVDYFVVTALKEEGDAVRRHLDNLESQSTEGFWIGTVNSTTDLGDGVDLHRVLLYLPGSGQGTKAAQSLAGEGIRGWNPNAVLLVGIAGGFQEHGVCLGDVLVPEFVDPYELAKKTPRRVIRREPPSRVSARKIWQLARGIAASSDEWYRDIKERRPDNQERDFPAIVVPDRGVLGSGDKNLADERAEERWYLKDAHGDRAIGFDMEAAGVMFACLENGRPFAVIKGVQDNGTIDKDNKEKDRWRLYACDAAATAAKIIMSRWCPPVIMDPRGVKKLLENQGTPLDSMNRLIRLGLYDELYPWASELIRDTARATFDEGRLTDKDRYDLVNRIRERVSERLPLMIESAYSDAVSNLDRYVSIDRNREHQKLRSHRDKLLNELPAYIVSEIESLIMKSPSHLLIVIDLQRGTI